MYKKLALIALAGASLPVAAQSSVTLYGIADAAVTYVKEGGRGSEFHVNSGNLNTSRIGLRGREDLGGGWAATFNLEAGVNLANGTIGSSRAFWNRQSWVGVGSSSAGEFRAGYQRPVMYDLLGPLSHTPPFGAPGARIDGAAVAGSSLDRFNNTIGTTRYANSLKYTSPRWAGLSLHALGVLDKGETAAATGRTWNLGVGYRRTAFSAGLSYLATACSEAVGCESGKARDTVWGAGAGYDFGPVRLNAIYTRQKNARNVAGNDADTASVGVIVPLLPWTLALGYQMLDDKSALNQDAKQLNFSAVYDLSKRTALYTIWVHQQVSNNGVAAISFLAQGSRQQQVSVGVRHRF